MSRGRRTIEPPTFAEAWASLRADYSAAKSSRFRRTRTGIQSGSGADYHYRSESDFLRMMEYARDMDRNDAIVSQGVDRAVVNTVQGGFRLEPQTGITGLDVDLAARWEAWATDRDACDMAGELTFHAMEALLLRQVFVDGDILALPNESGALQLVEAHRLRTPEGTKRNVVHGVLLDNVRRRLEYWLTREDVGLNARVARVSDISPYKARDIQGNRAVFHIYNPKRITQTRGVTAFAPMFDLLGMFEDLNFAKLVQAQIVSCFAILRSRDLGSDSPTDLAQKGEQSTATLSDGSSRAVEGFAPGIEYTGLPGESISGFSPNVPNAEFFPHAKLILTLIGINLGLPLILLMMDSSETNFSGWRGAMDQAKMGFRDNQARLADMFHREAYRWQLRRWMARDAALRNAAKASPETIFSHKWHFPVWPYIQPKEDADADAVRLDNHLASPRMVAGERGRDWDQVAAEIVNDRVTLISAAIEAAKTLNKGSSEAAVDWREVVGLAAMPKPKQSAAIEGKPESGQANG